MSDTTTIQKREPTADRRMAIARAARDLIAEKGLEGLRTRDIAAAVGINIATLHYHVPTKQDLVDLVAESIRGDFISQHLRRPRDGKSPDVLLRMELDDFAETMREQPELVHVLCALHDRGRRDPTLSASMRKMQDYWIAQIERILDAGRLDGSFRPDLDPPVSARLVTCALSDYWRRYGADDTYPAFANELMRAVLRPTPLLPKDISP